MSEPLPKPTRAQLLVMRVLFFSAIAAVAVVCFLPILEWIIFWTLLSLDIIQLPGPYYL